MMEFFRPMACATLQTLFCGLGLAVCSLLGQPIARGQQPAASQRPNILIIFTDDQGMHDVGCYGSEIPTPHIDSLARDGVKLTQFYAASAICTPSRFGLLTGRNPSRSHDRLLSALMFLSEDDRTRGIRADEITLATLLGQAGYDTALIGKWHLGHGQPQFSASQHGFEYSYGHTAGCIDYFNMSYGNQPDWYRNGIPLAESGYSTDLITDEAVNYLDSRGSERPFFLFLPYNAPHFGKAWDDGQDQTVNILQPHPRDLHRVRFITDPTRRKYAAQVLALDDGVGRVLEALDRNQLRPDTLVIFMTDHGGDPNYGGDNQPFRDGKATLFEGGLRVPCLVRWPEKIQPGLVSDQPTWALDWLPTLLRLAGAEVNSSEFDGRDIFPVLQGRSLEQPREFFWELGAHPQLERGNWLALRQGDWKYVADPQNKEWLFDLRADPAEQRDLGQLEAERLAILRGRAQQLSDEFRAAAGRHPSGQSFYIDPADSR